MKFINKFIFVLFLLMSIYKNQADSELGGGISESPETNQYGEEAL